jgi:hypothetical protein
MKSKMKIVAALVMVLSVSNLFAQTQKDETKTMFNHKNFKPFKSLTYVGIYVAPEIQYASLAGGFTPMGGVSAMLQANKKWGIGAVAYTTIAENYTPTKLSSAKLYTMDAQFGGLKLEYTPKPNSLIHVSFPLMIGAGMANIDSLNANKMDNERNYGKDKDGVDGKNQDGMKNEGKGKGENMFFAIQPGIHLEANVLKYSKIFIGANYRIAAGKSSLVSTNTVLIPTSNQLGGVSVNFGIKVGLFDFNAERLRKKTKI